MGMLKHIFFTAMIMMLLVVGQIKMLHNFLSIYWSTVYNMKMFIGRCRQAIKGWTKMWCFFISRVSSKAQILIWLLLSIAVVLPFPVSAGQTLDLNIGSAHYGNDLIIDVVSGESKLDGSTILHSNVFNSGQADAVIEIYNSKGDLVGLPKLIPGLRPYNSVLKIISTPITVGQSIFDDYSMLDIRNLMHSKKTSVDILVPLGGSFKLTKNGKWAFMYNLMTFMLDVIGEAFNESGDNISKNLRNKIFTTTVMGEIDLLRNKFLVNQLNLSDVMEFAVKTVLPFLDPRNIDSSTVYGKWVAKWFGSNTMLAATALLELVSKEADAITLVLTLQELTNAITYDTTISYVDRNTVGGNGIPEVVRPIINSINPISLQTKSFGTQTITILGLGFTSTSTANFTFDDLSGIGTVNITALNQPRFISPFELKYDINVGTIPGKWTVAVANGVLISRSVDFNVVSPVVVNTAPSDPISLNSIFGNWTKSRQFTLDWTNPASSAGISKVWWKIGTSPSFATDGSVAPINSAKPLQIILPVAEGQQDVYVWLEDGAGNRSHLKRASIRLGMDVTPPGIKITSQYESNNTQNTVTLSGTFNDSLSGVTQITWNNNSAAVGVAVIIPGLSGTWATQPIILYTGKNTIQVTATDAAGNYTTRTVTINKTDTTNSGSIMFTLSPTEAVTAGAKWRANGGVWHLSGEYELNVPAGVAQIGFQGANNYIAPQGYPVTVTAGQVTLRSESFPHSVVNVPPYTPSNPYPANGTVGLSRINPSFSWTGGGPVGGVEYHFMLGNTSSPEISTLCEFGFGAVAGSSVTCLRTLNSGTTYYWKVAARDATGAITNSPVWSFTTEYAMPDLIVSNIVLNGNVLPGANVTADVTVQNIGNFASYGTSYVHAYLSTSPGGKNVRLTPNVPNNVSVLQPGQTQTFNISVTLTGLQSGTSYLDVWIDSTQYGQVEGNIANNLRSIPLSYLDGQAPLITSAGLQNVFVKTGVANSIYYTATDDTGIRTMDFYYSVDEGINWLPIEEGVMPSTPPTYGTTHRWDIPVNLPIVSNLKIRVIARDAYGNAGEFIAGPYVVHDGTVPTVTLLSPNGGEIFGMGSTQQIKWNISSVNPIAGIDILFYYNGTAVYVYTGDMMGSGNQTYSWTLPDNFSTVNGKLRIHVQDINGNNAEDYSDGFFTVRDTSAPPPAPWTIPQGLVTGAWSPRLATDASGNLHMAYMVGQSIMYTKRIGTTWSSPQTVYSITSQTYGPFLEDFRLAVSKAGLPHMVWRTSYNGDITANNQSDIYFTSSDGNNWSAPFNLSTDLPGFEGVATASGSPQIQVDSTNTVHIVWTDGYYWNSNFTVTGQSSIYYRKKSAAGIWAPAINVSGVSAGSPALTVDGNSTLHLAFIKFTSELLYTSNSGGAWTAPTVVANKATDGSVRLASDSNNHLHMVWKYYDSSTSKNNIFYSFYNGVTWSSQEIVNSTTTNTFQPTINSDSLNRPHVTWEDWGYPYKLLYSYKSGNQWTTPIQLHYDSQIVSNYSSATALSSLNNEMHVAWVSTVNGSGTILYNHAYVGSVTDNFPPSVSVVEPVAETNFSMGSATLIQWNANDNVAITTVDLHYSVDNGVTWALIAATQPNTGTYSWIVPAQASLQIRVTAHDAAGNTGAGFSGSVTTSDETPPTIVLTAPVSGTSLVSNSTVNVNWTAADNVAVTRIDLDYSLDGGVVWKPMASALTNSGSYNWQVPNFPTSGLLIRAVAHDDKGHTTAFTTEQPLTIVRSNASPLAPSMPFPLAAGVNVPVVSPMLPWTGGDADGDALTYEVRLGTASNPSIIATVSNNTFATGTLQYSTKYYWQIVASDGVATTAGTIWNFVTESDPNSATIIMPEGFSKLQTDIGVEYLEREDGGMDSNNFDSSTGKPRVDIVYSFKTVLKDSSGNPPQYVKLYRTQRSNPTTDNFYGVDMTCSGNWATGATCSYSTLLGPAANHKFYFEAKLADNSTVRHPLTGWIDGPVTELLNGGNMVSIPRTLSTANMDGGAAFSSTSIHRYVSSGLTTDGNKGGYVAMGLSDFVNSGEGYYISKNNSSLPELGSLSDITDATYTFNLKPGWNIVGNPYGGNVKLSDVKVQKGNENPLMWLDAATNSWISNAIYYYKGSDWGSAYNFESAGGNPDASLVPWMGYWIYLKQDNDTYRLVIPRP